MHTTVQEIREGLQSVLTDIQRIREEGQHVQLWFCNMPRNKIDQIKIIRAVDSQLFGLKFTKDLVERLDPNSKGGMMGPIPFKGTLNRARDNFNGYANKYYTIGNYKANWIKTGVVNVVAD